MKRIFIDMDEVLADTLGEHIALYNRDHSEAVTKADLEGKWLWEIVSADRQERLEGYLRSEDFFEDLPVIEDSQRVVRELVKKYEVYIATAAMEFPNSFGPKYPLAAAAFFLAASVPVYLLRRQGHFKRRLPDRRSATALPPLCR